MDGRNPAPPKKFWNDDSPVNANEPWFATVSKWCRMSSIHSTTPNKAGIWLVPASPRPLPRPRRAAPRKADATAAPQIVPSAEPTKTGVSRRRFEPRPSNKRMGTCGRLVVFWTWYPFYRVAFKDKETTILLFFGEGVLGKKTRPSNIGTWTRNRFCHWS